MRTFHLRPETPATECPRAGRSLQRAVSDLMPREMTERLKEAFEYSAIWHLEKTECGDELTDEEDRNVKAFYALRDSVKGIPPELMQRTENLARKHPGAFELSLSLFLDNVNDRFRPSTATEFVRPMTAHVELAFEQSMTTLPLKLGKHTIGLVRYDEQGGFSIELGEG